MAAFLLALWVGPVSFIEGDWARAGTGSPGDLDPIPAGQAMSLAPGTPLTLHLLDGSVVRGRLLGRTLLDSALYVPRFERYANSRSNAPLVMGESLHVVQRDGRGWTARFAGYGEMTLLLANPDGPGLLRVPFEFADSIQRANGDRVSPDDLARAFRARKLPSAEALAIEGAGPTEAPTVDHWASALRVPVEDIESAAATVTTSDGHGGEIVGVIILSVALAVAVTLWILAREQEKMNHDCGANSQTSYPQLLSRLGVPITTRPFDRVRGCFAGDPVATTDLWTAQVVGGTSGPANPPGAHGWSAPQPWTTTPFAKRL